MRINLLPQPEPSRQYRTMILTGAAGVLALVNLWAGVAWMVSSAERRTADAAYDRAAARLPQLQQQAAELRKREELGRRIDAFYRWAANRPNFRSEVQLLSSLLPKDSALLSVHFAGESDYDVKASLPDLEAVATYLRQLQKNPQVASLKVKNVTRQTVALSPGGPPGNTQPVPAPPPASQQPPAGGTSAKPSPDRSGGTGTPSPNPGPVPAKPPVEDLLNGSGSAGGAGPAGAAGRTLSLWDRFLALLSWGTGVALASDGPVPPEGNPGPSGTAPAGGGTAPQANPLPVPLWPPVPGGAPQAGTAPAEGPGTQSGGNSAPPAKTVYELEFTVTLGR